MYRLYRWIPSELIALLPAFLALYVTGCHLIFPYNSAPAVTRTTYLCSAQIYRPIAGGLKEFTEEWRLYASPKTGVTPMSYCASKISDYISTSLAPGFAWSYRNLAAAPLARAQSTDCAEYSNTPLLYGAPLGAELRWTSPSVDQGYVYISLVDKDGVTRTAEPAISNVSIDVAEKTGLPDWSLGGTYVRGKEHARFSDFFLELQTPFNLGPGLVVNTLNIQSSGTIIGEKDSPGALYKIYSGRCTLFLNAYGQLSGQGGATNICFKNQAVGSFNLYQGPAYAFFTLSLDLPSQVIGQNMLIKLNLSKPMASPSSFQKHQPFVALSSKTVAGPMVNLAPDIAMDYDGDLGRMLWFDNFETVNEKFLGEGNPLPAMLTPGKHPVTLVAYDSRGAYSSARMDVTVTTHGYRLGPETQVSLNSNPEADRFLPAVAYNSTDKEYLVVWHNRWPSTARDIYASRVSNNGKQLYSFPVSTGSGNRLQPAVAYSATNHEYLVVWMYDVSGNGTQYEIWGRTVSWDGGSKSTEFLIFTWPTRSFWSPRVAWNGYRNQYMVIWNAQDKTSGLFTDVAGIRIADGVVQPGGAVIISASDMPQHGDIAYNIAADEYMVVWRALYGGGDWDIRGVRLRGDTGIPIGSPFGIGGSYQDEQYPSIATNQQGSYLVAWQQLLPGACCNWNIHAQELNIAGDRVGGQPVLADTADDELFPRVAARPGPFRDFMVVWERTTATGAAVYASRWGDPDFPGVTQVPIADYAFWYSQKPVVAAGKPGFYIAYEGDSNGDSTIYRHIYGQWWALTEYLPVIRK